MFARGSAILDLPAKLAAGFSRVEAEMEDWHRAWGEIIGYFYDGRMFSMYEGGTKLRENCRKWALPALMERHLSRQITRVVSGVGTRSRYGMGLISFTSRHLVWDVEPPEYYAVKG